MHRLPHYQHPIDTSQSLRIHSLLYNSLLVLRVFGQCMMACIYHYGIILTHRVVFHCPKNYLCSPIHPSLIKSLHFYSFVISALALHGYKAGAQKKNLDSPHLQQSEERQEHENTGIGSSHLPCPLPQPRSPKKRGLGSSLVV